MTFWDAVVLISFFVSFFVLNGYICYLAMRDGD